MGSTSTSIYYALGALCAVLGAAHEFVVSPVIAASLLSVSFPKVSDMFTPDEVAYFNLEQWHTCGLSVCVISALYFAAARAATKSERRALLAQIALALGMCIFVASLITGLMYDDPRVLTVMLSTPPMYVWVVISGLCALAMSMDAAAGAEGKKK